MEYRARLMSTDDRRALISDEEVQLPMEVPLPEVPLPEVPLPEMEVVDEMLLQAQTPQSTDPPPLADGELYHVFLSYSSVDSEWTESMMEELESRGLKVCCHHRDFTPGRAILDNMADCIAQSQKVLLVLSPDFMKSRWCLMEANMSLLKDCLLSKAIVPVLLRPVSIPSYLAHITYLEPQHPGFTMQLLRVLCKPNKHQPSTAILSYQPQSLYNGKSLQPLIAVNEEALNRYNCGVWSTEVPDHLRQIIREPQRYLQAISCINKAQEKAWFKSVWVRELFMVIAVLVSLTVILFYFWASSILLDGKQIYIKLGIFLFLILTSLSLWILWKLCTFKRAEVKRLMGELQSAVSRANILLCNENLLMGCVTNSKLYMVYVSLDDCRNELAPFLPFQKALQRYSCGYTCCLARRHFPFTSHPQPTHLEGGICFCQYVLYNLNRKRDCLMRLGSFWRK